MIVKGLGMGEPYVQTLCISEEKVLKYPAGKLMLLIEYMKPKHFYDKN